MTREEIIGMAREAGAVGLVSYETAPSGPVLAYRLTDADLDSFAALVAAKEREECAKVCESSDIHVGEYFAKEIRSMGME